MTGRREAQAYALLAGAFVVSRLALLWRFPPHVDESTFAEWTLRGLENPEDRFYSLVAGQQPLLEWVGMLVMRLGPEPLTALRLVSLVAGLGTGAIVVWLARRLGGATAGVVAGTTWLVLPFSLVYSVLGLYDPLATFFVSAAIVLAILLAARPRLDVALLLGTALGLGLLTKLTAQAAFVMVPVTAILLDWSPGGRWQRLMRWAGAVAVAFVVAWLLYRVMLLSQFSDDVRDGRDAALAVHSFAEFLQHPGRWIESNWPPLREALGGYLSLPLVFAATVGAGVSLRRSPRLSAVIVVWALVPVCAVVALADIPYVRWLLVGVPPLTVFAAIGVVDVVALVRRLAPGRRAALTAATAATLVLALPATVFSARILASPTRTELPARDDVDYLRDWSAGGPWLALVPDLRTLSAGDELVVVTAGRGFQYLGVALRHHTAIRIVSSDEDEPAFALAGVENGASLPDGPGALTWSTTHVYERPRGGVPVVLRQRAVRYGGRAMATPDELRAAIGGTDADFDAWIHAHASAAEWLVAWSELHADG